MNSMISNNFEAAILTSVLACLVTMAGIFIIRRYENWGVSNAAYFMSFAAGVLISVSFIHIIPRSFQMNENAPAFLLIGYMGLYLFNRFLKTYICHEHGHSSYSVGLIPMLGIGFHSFLDGVIYSVAFNGSIFTGFLAAIGMVLHEFPEGIVTFLLLKRGGFNKERSTWIAVAAAAVSTPVGTLVSYPFISKINDSTLGALLAISAGALIYVGASHLIPAVEKEEKRYTIVSLLSGVVVAVFIVLSK